jgi:protein TonB
VFENLVVSKPQRKRSIKEGAFSLVLHVVLVYAAVKATAGAAETLNKVLTDTTVVFLEPPKTTPPPPEPPKDVIVSVNPPPQGFQTVIPPAEIPTTIPPVNLSEKFDPKDFTGRGVEGGIAGGVVGGTGPVPTSGEVFTQAEVDQIPIVVSSPTPRYPPIMQSAGIPGQVDMQFVVDTSGHVEESSFKVIKSTHKAFEEPAREALMKTVFKPGKSRGHAVRVLVQQRMTFKIGE